MKRGVFSGLCWLALCGGFTTEALAQLTLTGSTYTQTFDGIGSGLPTGWTVRTGANSTSQGSSATFSTAATAWAISTGAFYNFASSEGLSAGDATATQAASTDRAVGIRQSGTFGDPGAAFQLQIANTVDRTGFSLSLKHQMLSVQPRSTTWSVQYCTNAAGTSWTTLGTYTDPGVFGSTSVSFSLGTAFDNIANTVYIRVVALTASTGTGTRDTYGLDDVELTWTNVGGCTVPDNVTTLTASPTGTTTIDIDWSGATCYDEFLVVAREAASIGAGTPTGDGSSYTADSDFSGSGSALLGGKVVYKGSGADVSISGLDLGTNYCFKIFTRRGTSWSSGVETCANTFNPTTFVPGEMVFVGYDSNIGFGSDKFSIVLMNDMEPGTSFILANMVYEYRADAYESTGLWYNGNGNFANDPPYVEITYTGGTTITKGSVICVVANTGAGNIIDFVYINGVDETANFTDDNGGYVNVSSTLGAADAIWLMQGTFSPVFTDGADLVRTFSGTVLGGIMFRGSFQPFSLAGNAGGSNRISRIHPDIICTGINITTDAADYYGYYNSTEIHTGTARNIVANIIDVGSNWTIATGGGGTDNISSNCSETFTISGGLTDGEWQGYSNNDWFNCANWENFTVPDATTDVVISSLALNDAVIDDDSPNAVLYGFNAACNSLTIHDTRDVHIADVGDSLLVYGNINITPDAYLFNNQGGYLFCEGEMFINSGTLDLTDSELHLQGNFTNYSSEAAFIETNSKVVLSGSTDQIIDGFGWAEVFHDLIIDKPSGNVLLYVDAGVTASLQFVSNTLIETLGNEFNVYSTDPGAITGYGLNAYIYGYLNRYVNTGSTYVFPVGTATQYEEAGIYINSMSGISYLRVNFEPTTPGIPVGLFSEGPVADGIVTPILNFLDYGYWEIEPDGFFSVNYDITLTSRGHTNAAAYLDFHGIFKNNLATSSTGWVEPGLVDDLAETPLSPTDPVTVTNLGGTSFSDFAIGFHDSYALPVTWLAFTATPMAEAVYLQWSTGSEINSHYFTVERSTDGVHFMAIGTVQAAGFSASETTYHFTDVQPVAGVSYYRIRQTDLDEMFTYSHTEAVEYLAAGVSFLIYPNPASATITIQADQEGWLQIWNPRSQQAALTQWVKPGTTLPVQHLPTGTYIVRFKTATYSQTQLLVIE